MSLFNQRGCFGCGGPLDGLLCRRCTCKWCGNNIRNEFCSICNPRAGNSFVYDPNPNSFSDPSNFFNHPPQPQTYSCELYGNDSHYGYDCPLRAPHVYKSEPCYNQNFGDNYYPQNSLSFSQQIFVVITMGDLMKFSSVNQGIKTTLSLILAMIITPLDLVPIPRESEDTSDSDKECDLPFCDNSVTFSNPCFDVNDDFTSSNDESLPEEDVLEDIENKDSYVSNIDELAFLVTPLSDAKEDECFDPGGDINEIDADVSTDIEDGYHDSEGDIIYLESLLINDTIPNLLPENSLLLLSSGSEDTIWHLRL
nr:pre-mRNA splicing Prp18-interacting factor [Tanacetum cinerariifolium]